MATNNQYGFTPQSQQPAFDPQAFADTLYAKMGAKRTAPPMASQPAQAAPAASPAQTPAQRPDPYAQPQRPIKTPFQEQMDRERAARGLREQARAAFYQNPANFRYGASQDPAQVAQFTQLNERAIAAERLAADAARARQNVSASDLNRTPQQVAAANASLLIQEAAQARANADRLRPRVAELRAAGDMAGAAAMEAQIAEFSRRASTASGNPMYDPKNPEAMRMATQSAANQQVMAVQRLEEIGRSRANLRRAASNEQQIRDQQSAEAQKMRDEQDQIAQAQSRLRDLVVQRQQAALDEDRAKVRQIDSSIKNEEKRLGLAQQQLDANIAANTAKQKNDNQRLEMEFANNQLNLRLGEIAARRAQLGLDAEEGEAAIGAVERADRLRKAQQQAIDSVTQAPEIVQGALGVLVGQKDSSGNIVPGLLSQLADLADDRSFSQQEMGILESITANAQDIKSTFASLPPAEQLKVRNAITNAIISGGVQQRGWGDKLNQLYKRYWFTGPGFAAASLADAAGLGKAAFGDMSQYDRAVAAVLDLSDFVNTTKQSPTIQPITQPLP